MYVKSLTLRGFKSFASATSLRFEPGISCVVGPNGSGKSNIVDAFAWVMGEQGAKSLRGGKMDDVVFAGTASRPPLGRAEVTLTIDNTDGALPIDYTEVTISRLLFRSGQSEYAINGNQCRLLDVTELLSDSGLGREMHVIVGQGQLDEVLHAGPEARRALIEEAAGVLKHRKRKEKALRKLEAMQVNLTRLVDLTGELRRRLGPLGRQAAIARRAASIQAASARRQAAPARRRLRGRRRHAGTRRSRRGSRPGAPDRAGNPAGSGPPAGISARRRRATARAQARGGAEHLVRALRARRTAARRGQPRPRAPLPAGRRPGPGPAGPRSRRTRSRGGSAPRAGSRPRRGARDGPGRAGAGRRGPCRRRSGPRRGRAVARRPRSRRGRPGRPDGQAARAGRCRAQPRRGQRGGSGPPGGRYRAVRGPGRRSAQAEHEEAQEMAASGTDDRAGLTAAHEEAAAALAESSARVAWCRDAERVASAERAALPPAVRRLKRACAPSRTAPRPQRRCSRTRRGPGRSWAG